MSPMSTIVGLLPKLTQEEASKVKGLLSHLSTFHQEQSDPKQSVDDYLYCKVLCDFLADHGLEAANPDVLLRVEKGFAAKLPDLLRYFVKADIHARTERLALVKVGIELLYNEMTERGDAVSSRTMMRQFHRLPAVLNANFPQYASSGMLAFIIRKQGHGSVPSRR